MKATQRKKVEASKISSFKVYSYATPEIGEWIKSKAGKSKVTVASFVYAALLHIAKTNKNFDPNEYLSKL